MGRILSRFFKIALVIIAIALVIVGLYYALPYVLPEAWVLTFYTYTYPVVELGAWLSSTLIVSPIVWLYQNAIYPVAAWAGQKLKDLYAANKDKLYDKVTERGIDAVGDWLHTNGANALAAGGLTFALANADKIIAAVSDFVTSPGGLILLGVGAMVYFLTNRPAPASNPPPIYVVGPGTAPAAGGG